MVRYRSRCTLLSIALLLLMLVGFSPAYSLAAPNQQVGQEPQISAKAAIVVDYPSGRILYQSAMHDRMAPASTTKILTSILTLEYGKLDEQVEVTADAMVGESTMGLQSGEHQSLHDLLYGMLLPSGNDAAMAVARYLGTQNQASSAQPGNPLERFTDMMNARASQLGLADSHFVNPHGLDAKDHYSSAYDLASLTWYALHFPVFNEIIKTPFYEAPGHPLKNTNEMLSRYPGADGVKTGWTDAGGLCLVTTATRDGHRLISVVLNAPHWYQDSAVILDYGLAKLAAGANGQNTETLSVAGRGAASWLLVSATPSPPMSAPDNMKQGGGVAAASDVASNNSSQNSLAVQDSGTSFQIPFLMSQQASASNRPWPAMTWYLLGLVFLATLAVGLWLIPTRLVPILRLSVQRLGGRRLFAYRPAPTFPKYEPVHASEDYGQSLLETIARPVARTLGTPPLERRRAPNLLLSPEEVCNQHIEQAVALAGAGRQGASMAEFLIALRSGCDLRVQEINIQYDLTPTGFLALYGAQMAAGTPLAARDTLEYAVAAMPSNRILSLSLRQQRTQ